MCVITCVSNYCTSILTLYPMQFIGDIGQPLHDENYEVGGNDISAICNGKTTNLHAAWGQFSSPPLSALDKKTSRTDTGMLTTSADDRFDGDAETYATYLAGEINVSS